MWRPYKKADAIKDDLLDSGPHPMHELPAVFAKADYGQLRRHWVACVIDSITTNNGCSVPQLTLALNAVAVRFRKSRKNSK